MNKKLYWTDAEENDIEVYHHDPNPARRFRKVLIRTGVGSESIPRAIVLDPATRLCLISLHIYYTVKMCYCCYCTITLTNCLVVYSYSDWHVLS